jgi:8-oxo-dGDP phosphatase
VIGMLALDAARRRDWSTLRPADAPWPALQDRRA